MSIEPGARVGRFELIAPLGRGGMGEVWRALDPRLSREVAVKILPEELGRDPEWVGRFEREARALAALSHPNVAQIYEVGEVDGGGEGADAGSCLRFLVIELVDGTTLRDRIRRGRLPEREAIAIAVQIARALAAAHARGVIHRDLKPANVMLAADGTAKVLDFGLARLEPRADAARDADITLALSRPGTVVGTASYMAPEQIRGEECDDRCDVWAFGCCLAEMLSGERLFGGATVTEIAERVLAGSSSIAAPTPRAVRELLADCLRPDRRRRPRMDEVVRRLEELSRRPHALTPGRWVAWLLGAGALAAAAILFVAVGRGTGARPGAPPAGPRPLRVTVEPAGRGTAVGRVADALTRALAARDGVELADRNAGGVGVRVAVEPAANGGGVKVSLIAPGSGAVEGIVERPFGTASGEADLAAVTGAVLDGVDRLAVIRRLDGEDLLHGFLARRTRTAAAARAFERGVALYGRTRRVEAGPEFRAALAAEPGFWPAHLYLAQIAASTGRFGEGRAELAAARAALARPDAVESAVLEVVAALMMDDNQRLSEALSQARAAFPGSGELLYRSAWAYRQLGRPAEAVPLLEQLVARGWQPDWSPTWVQLAYCQLLDGRIEPALATASAAEGRFPQNPNFPYVIALAERLRSRSDASREAMARAIRKREDFSAADPLAMHQVAAYWCSLIGWREERVRQLGLWLQELDRRLASSPADGSLLQQKAEALLGLGRPEAARDLLQPLAGASRDPYVLVTLGRACFAVGDGTSAGNALARASELWRSGSAPALGALAYNIACAFVAGGDREAALRWLERAADQHGFDRLEMRLDPDLAPLREAGLLARFDAAQPGGGRP